MESTAEQLPIFVYGTLRHGQINYRRFLAGKTEREEPAVLPGHVLHTEIYPYVFDTDDGSRVYGELMFPLADGYDDLLARLDELEGYRAGDASSAYLRVTRRVEYTGADGETLTATAWVYHAGTDIRTAATEATRVKSGDWLSNREGR